MISFLSLQVIPGASSESFELLPQGGWKMRIQTPAHEGQANKMVCLKIATFLKIKPAQVRLLSGKKSRHKRLQVKGLSEEETIERLTAITLG